MDSLSSNVYIDVPHISLSDRPPSPTVYTQFRDTDTTSSRWGGPAAPLPNTSTQRGENYGDSAGGLWTMYLIEAEKQVKKVYESLKGDADGILVFTGLFSATIAAFLIESYKQLSPDSSVTTNALLTRISQQLDNISSGTPLASVSAQNSQPFKPTASAVRVNVLWFLSLAINLNCALSATLMQQWARQYQELTQQRGAPYKRVCIQSFTLHGLRRFGILARVVMPITGLLHVSVFLFFAGLVEFLFPIYTTVAYTTLGCVAMFALIYAILTVLPNIYLNCPYGTPMSEITWRLSQFSLLGTFLAVLGIEGPFHGLLLSLWYRARREVTGILGPTKWRYTLETQVVMRHKWLKDGLRKSVELRATYAPPTMDTYALELILTPLYQHEDIENFAASIPGFFDSKIVEDPTSAILPLMSDRDMTDPILGSRLRDLLNTCIPGTSLLTEEKRRSRLRVCLKSLWYCGKAYNRPQNPEFLPSYVRVVFADPEMTRRIQAEEDVAARIMGRCFGVLVAMKLLDDIQSLPVPVTEGVLACLSAILNTDSREVMSWLGEPGAIEFTSIVSLISAEADSLVADEIPPDVLDMLKQTLRVLSQNIPMVDLTNLPQAQVERFHGIYSAAPNWLKGELLQISDRLPPNSSYT